MRADSAILAAARRQLASHGVRDLRMSDVAERAGVGGVRPDPGAQRLAHERIRELASSRPLVYLPAHDPRHGRAAGYTNADPRLTRFS